MPPARGLYQPPLRQTVIYGSAVEDALVQPLSATSAQRWAVVTTRSLSGPRRAAALIHAQLGAPCVGIIFNSAARSPRQGVNHIARDVQAWDADGIVAGGNDALPRFVDSGAVRWSARSSGK